MYEIPLLLVLKTQLVHMAFMELLILAVMILLVIQNARRNHLLKTINRTLSLHPEIQFERRLAAAEKRAVR